MELIERLGGLLIFVGVAMFILPLMGLTIVFMDWMYNWGPTNAMLIKIAFIVIGAILWFIGSRASDDDYEDEI